MPININTNDYDMYNRGDTIGALSGSASTNPDQGQLFTRYGKRDSLFNQEKDEQTGVMTDFWDYYPVIIDVNGDVHYNNENTGINVRGPAGYVAIKFDDLTPAQVEMLKGENGVNGEDGVNGADGKDGVNGKSAYQLWLDENDYSPEAHPLSEFFAYLANLNNELIKEGSGQGSLILNYNGNEGEAIGQGSLAINYGNRAGGNYSFAQGYNTRANYSYQAVFGKYNLNDFNNILEVGNGTDSQRKNIFSISQNGDGSFQGNIAAGGEITDGNGNVLSNKLDKIDGKVLSTNDFSDSYKSKLDSLTVDDSFSLESNNPIANKTVATRVNQIEQGYHLLEQIEDAAGAGYPIITLDNYSQSADPHVTRGRYSRNILYDLTNNAYKFGNTNSWGAYNKSNILIGTGLTTSEDYQIALGKYNSNKLNNFLEIGYGSNSSSKKNILELDKLGNLLVNSITDAEGNVLSEKQDILSYDTVPTANSTNLITSGNLYQFMIDNDIITTEGSERNRRIQIIEEEIDNLQAADTAINSSISDLTSSLDSTNSELTALEATVAANQILTDETTGKKYNLTVNNGELQLKEIIEEVVEEEKQGGE